MNPFATQQAAKSPLTGMSLWKRNQKIQLDLFDSISDILRECERETWISWLKGSLFLPRGVEASGQLS